ncbi:volume-regulated anion channel subunit LRRC8C-like [Scleropages formosus]|uniref:Volume-regulated anion channel subunit LRRC8C-like n=1 Tax=Scleropages formosus TaxID=113540 RepID=A0A0P7UQP9_SCLFO|nr:volume-regulated anion channel subunit LRRC8C-like [Scleropages formosus]
MIPVTEFQNFSSVQNPQFRVLKPWWDVFTDYLCIAMLMMGVFGCSIQLTQDKISCLPSHVSSTPPEEVQCRGVTDVYGNKSLWESNTAKNQSMTSREMFGRKNHLDIHQYIFVNNYCYEKAVHWYGKYFPYLVVIHTVMFMVASSFWFKFPGTSSKIELFVAVLGKCFNSPWTTRTISEVSEDHGEERVVIWKRNTASSESSPNESPTTEDEAEHLFRSASVKSNTEKKVPEPAPSLLDKKEGEEAKALFEKVKKFRTHVEEADLLYTMYVLQTSIKMVKFAVITIYSAVLVPNIQVVIQCAVPKELTGYSVYCCNHVKAHFFSKLAYSYICFVGVYGLLCIYTLYWVFHRPLKIYSFETVRLETGINDIPDVKNDFAFLLHLCDQYDALYSKRFAMFLSEVSESRLQQLNLNNEWTVDKVRQRMSHNASERLELHLLMLPGLPDTIFEIPEVESLKLELMSDITIPGSISQLSLLQELSLIHCPAKLQLAALNHLQEHLKVLHLTFERPEQIPPWMYTLQGLKELHLTGPLTHELSKNASLDPLSELKSLQVLTLHSHLNKIPQSVGDVGGWLQRLAIRNEGTALRSFHSIKKLTSLTSLELRSCALERIPNAVLGLTNLEELDLKENKLMTVEEILSLQHCRQLVTLRLWHNNILYIPENINKLLFLETLNLSWNKLRTVPISLFYCTRLRHLNLSHNQLTSLPPEIGTLQSLQYLSVASNSLDSLPDELFFCKRLKGLILTENNLTSLSPRVSNLTRLVRLELKGNRLEYLPLELRDCCLLKLSGLVVEERLFDLLPSDIRRQMSDT